MGQDHHVPPVTDPQTDAPALIGVDVGGTFTDFVFQTDTGLEVLKRPTSVPDPGVAVRSGVDAWMAQHPARRRTEQAPRIRHGTTIATNAVLQRKGARTALIATAGFRDLLVLGRQNRPSLYALSQSRPALLVPDELRFEVRERVTATGEVQTPLDLEDVDRVIDRLKAMDVEAVCVVFLFSFLYPEHEQTVGRRLAERLPDIPVSLSVDVLPEYREFERTITTATNAWLQPAVGRYLARLARGLPHRSFDVMQSNGGTTGLRGASRLPVHLLVSGPAGGVVGALNTARIAMATATPQIMTLDMGGTSTDVALCQGGTPITTESEIGGLPIRVPLIDIHTVGAGGGSLARVDSAGTLRVGPGSAGAEPGPACYGRGGRQATVTDANLVLGRLLPDWPLGGTDGVSLKPELAEEAVARLGAALGGRGTVETALAIVDIANAAMERALRVVSVETGHNPAEFTLLPFGGAGALHACDLAQGLDMRRILVPETPGVLSAQGLLLAETTRIASRSVLMTDEEARHAPAVVARAVRELTGEARRLLEEDGETDFAVAVSADVRYRGQSHELQVPCPTPITPDTIEQTLENFHLAHEKRFGFADRQNGVEIVNLRVMATCPPPPSPVQATAAPAEAPGPEPTGTTLAWFSPEAATPVPWYARTSLAPGHRVVGPALILQPDCTTLVGPGWQALVDSWLNLQMTPLTTP